MAERGQGVTLDVALDGIPWDMRVCPQRWGGWRLESRSGKPTKVPWSIVDRPHEAASTKPEDWCDFPEAAAFYVRRSKPIMTGLGFRLGDGWAGVDLDGCRDPDIGTIHPWAQEVINRLDSYTEVSPSGTGVKVFLVAEMPSQTRHRTKEVPIKEIEMYDRGRYFTVTGHHLAGTPTEFAERSPELGALYSELFPPEKPQENRREVPAPTLDDSQLISKMLGAKNGQAVWRLWNGDTGAYGSKSEADLALVSHIAFYVGRVPARIDSIFRQSKLYRDKWDEKHGAETYGSITIAKALSDAREFYRGPTATGTRSEGLPWWPSLNPA